MVMNGHDNPQAGVIGLVGGVIGGVAGHYLGETVGDAANEGIVDPLNGA
ncbi:Uncharacterised protein [Schaalia odontolytica]|uniref:Uncharacterized protein n=1 Tax=Schaalia odontolytica TaxID=1660 RepID=A0A2X0TXQ2_9ACTO|nr:Uncharacterised protein [Schaalia odontolytica]